MRHFQERDYVAIHRNSDGDDVTITFVLADQHEPVSVVGSFNDWTPGAHPLVEVADGSSSVTIVVPVESEVHFRYLGSNGQWFDDPDADEINPDGSILRPAVGRTPADDSADEPGPPTQPAAASPGGDGPSGDAAAGKGVGPAAGRTKQTKGANEG